MGYIQKEGLEWIIKIDELENWWKALRQHDGSGLLRDFEQQHEIFNNVVCATSKGTDQPAQSCPV